MRPRPLGSSRRARNALIARTCREPPQTLLRHVYRMARDFLFRRLGEPCQPLESLGDNFFTLRLHPSVGARRVFAEYFSVVLGEGQRLPFDGAQTVQRSARPQPLRVSDLTSACASSIVAESSSSSCSCNIGLISQISTISNTFSSCTFFR